MVFMKYSRKKKEKPYFKCYSFNLHAIIYFIQKVSLNAALYFGGAST